MSTSPMAPGKAVLIDEAAVATGISSHKIKRLIDEAVLPKSICIKVGKRRALRAFALPMVSFGASGGAGLSKNMRLKVMRRIEEFTKENWPRLCSEPEHARFLRFESGCLTVSLGEPVSTAMAGLNKLSDALHRIVADPDVRGGLRVMRGTRIGVYEVADAFFADGMETALEDFPALKREDVEAAVFYARAHPRTGRRFPIGSGSRRLVSEKTADLIDVA